MTIAAITGTSQRKPRAQIVRIAGNPLESYYHSVTGNGGRDGWKSVGIGQSAARSDRVSYDNELLSGTLNAILVLGFVGSSSPRSHRAFVIQKNFGLFLLSSEEGQDLQNEPDGKPISPNDGVSRSLGWQRFSLNVAAGEICDELDGVVVTHRHLDTGAVLDSDRACLCGKSFDQEASFAIHYSSDVRGLSRFHEHGPLVQRLSRKGVGVSAPKHTISTPSYTQNERMDSDIVSSAPKGAAVWNSPIQTVSASRADAKIRPYAGDEYFGIAWPTTWRPMKNLLEGIYQYRDEGFQMIYNGEIGKYEGVRFIEQTNMPHGNYNSGAYPVAASYTTWSNALSDWIFFFGEDTVAEAMVVPEEMRGKIA